MCRQHSGVRQCKVLICVQFKIFLSAVRLLDCVFFIKIFIRKIFRLHIFGLKLYIQSILFIVTPIISTFTYIVTQVSCSELLLFKHLHICDYKNQVRILVLCVDLSALQLLLSTKSRFRIPILSFIQRNWKKKNLTGNINCVIKL